VVAELCLKPGAQVVLLRNLSAQLANGSRGVVVGFDHAHGPLQPLVRFDCGATRARSHCRFALPLIHFTPE
jgi:hypothetical protein